MIKFACTQCGKMISAADEHAGRKAKCPMCQAIQVIPAPGASSPKPAPRPATPAPPRPPAKAPPPAVQAKKPAPRPPEDDMEEVEEVEEDFEVVEEPEEVEVAEEADEEPEEEERPRRPKKKKKRRWRGEWADCPNCGAPGDATRLSWTWWGGFIGPMIICHVRCNQCGTAYNGKSGDYNTGRIAIYYGVSIGIALLIVCGLGLMGLLTEH